MSLTYKLLINDLQLFLDQNSDFLWAAVTCIIYLLTIQTRLMMTIDRQIALFEYP